jgi:hypothetical protein
MFITANKIAFVELPKTGTTHVDNLLSQLLDGHQIGKHNRPGRDLWDAGHTFVGSIRNPWDWYVSLWTYGCNRKGGVYENATRPLGVSVDRSVLWRHPAYVFRSMLSARKRRPEAWLEVYANAEDPDAFRQWLRMMHDPAFWSDFGEGYSLSTVKPAAGFYSYRFLCLFCRDATPLFRSSKLGRYDELAEFERRQNYISHFIRCESLESDLIKTLAACGSPLCAEEEAYVLAQQKSNVSSRGRDLEFYYDQEAIDLISAREKLITERFGYAPPCI